MRRIRASDGDVAAEIEVVLHETVGGNWRHGNAMPSRRSCPNVQDAAKFMRLTKQETYLFLKAAGCSEAEMYPDLPEVIFQRVYQRLFVKLIELSRRDRR